VIEQWPTASPDDPGVSLSHAPHMTAFCDAFLSSSGGWQAALIAALQLPTNGMPALTFERQ